MSITKLLQIHLIGILLWFLFQFVYFSADIYCHYKKYAPLHRLLFLLLLLLFKLNTVEFLFKYFFVFHI